MMDNYGSSCLGISGGLYSISYHLCNRSGIHITQLPLQNNILNNKLINKYLYITSLLFPKCC